MHNSASNLKKRSLELEDHSWFPDALRAYQTDLLGFLAKHFGLYQPAKNFLKAKVSDGQNLVDLASGSGIPAIITVQNRDLTLTLCDKFPNSKTVDFVNQNYNATYLFYSVDLIENEIPEGHTYLMYNSLHHFNFAEINIILKKVKAAGGNAYFFEPLTPTLFTFLKVVMASIILPFFVVPFIKPFRWDRLLFTYILPLGVIATLWDGVISVFKSYSLRDLEKLKNTLHKSDLQISVGVLRGKFTNLTYIEL